MGTQVTGRKRIPNKEKFTAEDDALNQIAREVSFFGDVLFIHFGKSSHCAKPTVTRDTLSNSRPIDSIVRLKGYV